MIMILGWCCKFSCYMHTYWISVDRL